LSSDRNTIKFRLLYLDAGAECGGVNDVGFKAIAFSTIDSASAFERPRLLLEVPLVINAGEISGPRYSPKLKPPRLSQVWKDTAVASSAVGDAGREERVKKFSAK
jgi:hypothetical protein